MVLTFRLLCALKKKCKRKFCKNHTLKEKFYFKKFIKESGDSPPEKDIEKMKLCTFCS